MSFVNVIGSSGTIISGSNLTQTSSLNFVTNSSLTNTNLDTGGIDISGNINTLQINYSNSIYGGGGSGGIKSGTSVLRFGRNGGHSIKIESSIQVSNITNLGILCGGGGGGGGTQYNAGNYGGAGGGGGAGGHSTITVIESGYGGSDTEGGSGTAFGASGGGGGFGYSGGNSDFSGYVDAGIGGISISSGNICIGGKGGSSSLALKDGGNGIGYGGGGGGSSVRVGKGGGGGGGAGCGKGGGENTTSAGGGGSGGGLNSKYITSPAFLGGGGYSIFNLGSLTTLENLQGTTSTHGPLFIAGNMPNSYNIIIQDASYGQLAYTGWYAYTNDPSGNTTLQNFNISLQSSNASSGIYYSVLIGITPQILSGSIVNREGNFIVTYNWLLSLGTSVVLSGVTYQTYDLNLIVTKDLACFLESSKILTNMGYKAIEELKIGDLVKTLCNDFKSIKIIGKSTIFNSVSEERIKNQLYRCPQINFPELFEDLIITGCHSILVDNFSSKEQIIKTKEINGDIYITDNKYRLPACIDERTCVYRVVGNHNIYHIALENDDLLMNYGIFANGLLVESSSIWSIKENSKMELIE